MKKLTLILLTLFLILAISCASKQETEEETVQSVEDQAQEGADVDELVDVEIDESTEPELEIAEMSEDTELTPIDEEVAAVEEETEVAVIERIVPPPLPPVVQPPQTLPPPPVQPQEPPLVQTPPQDPQQQTTPDVSAEEPTDTDALASTRRDPLRDYPSSPAVRVEPLPQMGAVPQGDIVFSRVVRATVGQIIEIPFRGTGWVYLGELASKRGIVYNSRRNDTDGQTFIFTTEEAGTYSLKFFKEDFIRDYIINDHVQVIVGEAQAAGAGWFNPPYDRGRITAEPRWPSAIEEAQIRNGTFPGTRPAEPQSTATPPAQTPSTPPSSVYPPRGTTPAQTPPQVSTPPQVTTPPQETVTVQPPVSAAVTPQITEEPSESLSQTQAPPVIEKLPPEVILQRAQETFEGENVAGAIALLDQFMEYYPGGSDELYWMYGQFYEANSPSRNILLSLDYYRRLVNEYPQSRRFNDARRRIAYLERFYINIQ
ncbi:MAG: hypothetical protein LBI28_07940 [Treponema sp.]|jgi:hypothetical protein|nr:hypothetical protein [Treponema sp.]